MRLHEVKNHFRELTKMAFPGAKVIFSNQSRAAKTNLPLIVIDAGNVKRPLNPSYKMIDGELVGYYHSRVAITIDLFTHGLPVYDDESGQVVAYDDTALDDMLVFADFLGSYYVIDWCHRHDVSIVIDGEAQDLTGVVNDNNYAFRSRLNIMFYFTQYAIGYTATASEDSIKYPTGEYDADGNPIYTTTRPEDIESVSGQYGAFKDNGAVLSPNAYPGSAGISDELINESTGYFTEVEIKEDTGNE